MIFPQKVQCKKPKKIKQFDGGETCWTSAQPGEQSHINNNNCIDCRSPWLDVMNLELFLCYLPPKTSNPSLIRRKMLDKSSLRDGLQNPWAVLLITVKVFKNREKLRYGPSPEEPKGTGWLRYHCCDTLDGILKQERDIRWKKPRESL